MGWNYHINWWVCPDFWLPSTVFHSKFYGSIDPPDTPSARASPPKNDPNTVLCRSSKMLCTSMRRAFGWKIPSPNLSRPLAWSYDDIFQIILPPKNGYKLFSNKADGGQDDSASCYNSRKKPFECYDTQLRWHKLFFKIKHRCVGTSDFGLRWLSRPSQWCYHVKLHHHGQALRPRSHRPFPWHLWSRCRKHRCNPKRGAFGGV